MNATDYRHLAKARHHARYKKRTAAWEALQICQKLYPWRIYLKQCQK